MDLAALSTLHGYPVVYLPEVDSTNRVARELARTGWRGLVVADHQTAGRGRLGRSWVSEPGQNLLFSAVLAPPPLAREAPRAVLLWAAALAEALELWLKWPNDLIDEGDHKVGGLLAELEAEGEQARAAVLGVGLNVNQLDFRGLPPASSLRAIRGARQDRVELLSRCAEALYNTNVCDVNGLDRWRARSRTLGRRVRVGEIEGVATGLREDGALLVDGEPVLAGDVSLVG